MYKEFNLKTPPTFIVEEAVFREDEPALLPELQTVAALFVEPASQRDGRRVRPLDGEGGGGGLGGGEGGGRGGQGGGGPPVVLVVPGLHPPQLQDPGPRRSHSLQWSPQCSIV